MTILQATGRKAVPALLSLMVGLFIGTPIIGAGVSPGDARRGASLYAAKCGACHSPDAHRIGPMHRGVVGRISGTSAGYAYSPALKRAKIRWNTASLDRWLINPVAMVPGTKMGIRVPAATDRADLIAYLRTLTTKAR